MVENLGSGIRGSGNGNADHGFKLTRDLLLQVVVGLLYVLLLLRMLADLFF